MINDLYSSLKSSYNNWSSVLGNPRFIKKGFEITWKNYSIQNLDDITSKDILNLISDRQYTFQIFEDGSIIQIYYSFKRRNIIRQATLAYYGNILSRFVYYGEEEEIKLNIEEESFSEDYVYTPAWLRIDYKPADTRGILHSSCHLHISSFPTYSRININGIMNPAQFIEFIIATFYPHIYRENRIGENNRLKNSEILCDINRSIIPFEEDEECYLLPHVKVPYHV